MANIGNKIVITGIKWDADDMKDVADLPTTVELSFNSDDIEDIKNEDCIDDFIENKLSDQYGFTHDGWDSSVLTERDVAEGFDFDGINITNPNMDETARFQVNPTIYYKDAYNKWMIEINEKTFNERLLPYRLQVTIFETSEIYEAEDGDDDWEGLPMFEAYIETTEDEEQVDDTTTGRYCSLESVCHELESFVLEQIESVHARVESHNKTKEEASADSLEFDDIYTLVQDIKSFEMDEESQAGMFETYGKDLDIVKCQNEVNPKKVWTVLDGEDDSNIYAHAGLMFSSFPPIDYMISNEEWKSEDEKRLIFKSEVE